MTLLLQIYLIFIIFELVVSYFHQIPVSNLRSIRNVHSKFTNENTFQVAGSHNNHGRFPPRTRRFSTDAVDIISEDLSIPPLQVSRIPKYLGLLAFANQTAVTNKIQEYSGNTRLWIKGLVAKDSVLVQLVSKFFQFLKIFVQHFRAFLQNLIQYCNPLSLVFLKLFRTKIGSFILKKFLLLSVLSGVFKMISEYSQGYLSSVPLVPEEDSYALITGGSSDLGKELAQQLFDEGFNLILISSNQTRLQEARSQIQCEEFTTISPSSNGEADANIKVIESTQTQAPKRKPDIQLIECNLEDSCSPYTVLKELKKRGLDSKIDVLVCNAGKASYGSVLDSSYLDTRRSLDVNVASHIGLIQMIVPKMIERQKILKTKQDESDNVSSANTSRRSRGRLVIVSSIAGQASSSKTSLYSASKAFLNTFAYGLRKELLPQGITVTLALPGVIPDTNFFQSIPNLQHSPMKSYLSPFFLSAQQNSKKILKAVRAGHETVIPGQFNQFLSFLGLKLLPQKVITDLVDFAWSPQKPMTIESVWQETKKYFQITGKQSLSSIPSMPKGSQTPPYIEDVKNQEADLKKIEKREQLEESKSRILIEENLKSKITAPDSFGTKDLLKDAVMEEEIIRLPKQSSFSHPSIAYPTKQASSASNSHPDDILTNPLLKEEILRRIRIKFVPPNE